MESYNINYATQNRINLHSSYTPGLITNPIQTSNIINNSRQIVQQYDSLQTPKNPRQSRYNPANISSPQFNPYYQIQASNSTSFPPNQNANKIKQKHLFKNSSNIIYNQPPMINKNFANTVYKQVPLLNNNISYNPIIISKPNMIQGKTNHNQVPPLNNSNNNIKSKGNNQNLNQVNSGNNISNKNSINQYRRVESLNEHPPIPLKLTNHVMKSICKISYHYNNKTTFGTGFFMKYSDTLKLLITNYHVIFPKLVNNKIQIEIWNSNKMILNLMGRYIKFLDAPKDITAIEIKTTDEIYKDIQFLNYDLNFYQYGYNIYNNTFIFSIEHPLGQEAAAASGKIINIYEFQFDHNIATNKGSSGSPIILLSLMTVIGIHKNTDGQNINGGTFIGEIIKEINKKPKNIIENYIIAEILIKDEDVNKKVRIINSYEDVIKDYIKFEEKLKNFEKIRECEIKINNEFVPFNYFYEFKQKGKYIINYKFRDNLTNVNHMFYGCKSLINLNFTNFDTKSVYNMSYMFFGCESLTNLNLSNFDTQNVNDMSYMFARCKSLTNLNLSNFNTQNVINMKLMFDSCESLINLNLSNFNTQNVNNMRSMFCKCKSLINLNLSNFNTQNVNNMGFMFSDCELLIDLNLSIFNTKNVIDMQEMFYKCKSLTNLNLSNFNTQNVTNLTRIFYGCELLKKGKVITNDSKILGRLQ